MSLSFCSTTNSHLPLQKCGEISTYRSLAEMNKMVYALNCIFCETVYLQLDAFASHIENKHSEELSGNTTETRGDDEQIASSSNVKQCEQNSSFPQNLERCISHSASDLFDTLQDPLDEPSLDGSDIQEQLLNTDNSKDEDESSVIGINKEINRDDEWENEKSDDDQMDTGETDDCSESEAESGAKDLKLNDKELTLAIIREYQKHSLLWEKNHPLHTNKSEHKQTLKKIANTINRQKFLELKWQDIGEIIKRIRYRFRTELRKHKMAESKGTSYIPPYFYEELLFLSKSVRYKQRNKRGAKVLAFEKPALPLSKLTHPQNLQLIEIYQNFPCLWNVDHLGFRFKNKRQEALKEMLQVVKSKMGLDITESELQKKLYRIRYACTQEKHRRMQYEHLQQEFEPACVYYKNITFLEDHVGPFKCSVCEQVCYGADQYKIHQSTHDGSMPFTCPICSRGFMKVGNRNVHIRRHTRDYPFECKICSKRFATTTDVTVHMRYHTGEKPYFCEVCGQSFRTWTYFDAHMRRHQKLPSHKCTICSKAFYENNKLTEHMKAHLNVRDKVCNICGKAFTTSKNLRQHKEIHADKKKYACKICGKDFAQYAGLSGHMKSHGTAITSVGPIEDSI